MVKTNIEIELLQEILAHYDKFMLSNMDIRVTNLTWLNICNTMNSIRIYLHSETDNKKELIE